MPTRDKTFQVRVTESELAEIDERAIARGFTRAGGKADRSAYVRSVAMGEAQPVQPELVPTTVDTPVIEAEPVLALPDPSPSAPVVAPAAASASAPLASLALTRLPLPH